MNVQSEDQQGPGKLLQLFDDAVVPDARREHLVLPKGKRVRPGRGDGESDTFGGSGQLAPDAEDLGLELGDVGADLGTHLDDGLVQLALDLLSQGGSAGHEQLGDVRPQFRRVGIDDLKFLFDADGKPVRHGGMILQSGIVAVLSPQSSVGSRLSEAVNPRRRRCQPPLSTVRRRRVQTADPARKTTVCAWRGLALLMQVRRLCSSRRSRI